jgi:hypothetical protein
LHIPYQEAHGASREVLAQQLHINLYTPGRPQGPIIGTSFLATKEAVAMNHMTNTRDDAARPASVLNVLAGIWLIISPWVLSFSTLPVAVWNMVLVGIAVLILAAIRLGTTQTTGLSWVNFILGLWLIISPFVLNFRDASTPMGNAIFLGILVGCFSLWAALASQSTYAAPR